MAKLRVGVIGCGGRGRAHAVGYRQSDRVEMVACADPFEEARSRLAQDFSIPRTYADYNEMLASEELDVVSIGLWIALHHDAVMACVNAASRPRLINAEKPMAPTFGEARRMHEACEAAGVMLTFSHQRRFGPMFTRARDLLKQGAIGDLIRMECFCSNLFDWGTHWFDMMFFYNDDLPADWVMGQIDCLDDRTIFGTPIETNGLSYVKWKNGVTGLLATGDDHGGRCQNRLIGTEGMIVVDRGVHLLREGAAWETQQLQPSALPGADTTLYMLESIDCVLTGRESILSSRKALQATELIFGTYESARRRAMVRLPLEIDDSPLLSMLANGDVVIPDWPARLTGEEESEGFELLFNGKDLSGWQAVGPDAAWRVEKGLLVCEGGGPGLRADRAVSDFVLRFQYRPGSRGLNSLLLRAGEHGAPGSAGIEIPLNGDQREPVSKRSTGGICGVVAPSANATSAAGRWNHVEVTCRGPAVRVVVNNREVLSCDASEHPELRDRPLSGCVALQNREGAVKFRSLRVKGLG